MQHQSLRADVLSAVRLSASGKSGILRHVQSCREKERVNRDPTSYSGGISERGFHLAVEGRNSPEYWLLLDVSAGAPLAVLDRYLRNIRWNVAGI